jgi:hypothetical protein
MAEGHWLWHLPPSIDWFPAWFSKMSTSFFIQIILLHYCCLSIKHQLIIILSNSLNWQRFMTMLFQIPLKMKLTIFVGLPEENILIFFFHKSIGRDPRGCGSNSFDHRKSQLYHPVNWEWMFACIYSHYNFQPN